MSQAGYRITYNGWYPRVRIEDLQAEIEELRNNPAAAAGPVIREGTLSAGNRQADEQTAGGFLMMDDTLFYPEVFTVLDVVFPFPDVILALFLTTAGRAAASPDVYAGNPLTGVAKDTLLWMHRSTRAGLVQVGVTATPQFTPPSNPELYWIAKNASSSAKLLDFPIRILGQNRKEFDPNPPNSGGFE